MELRLESRLDMAAATTAAVTTPISPGTPMAATNSSVILLPSSNSRPP